MKNKHVGWLIIGIAAVISAIVLMFNLGLKDIVSKTCTHGSSCSMYSTISLQTYLSLAIAALVFFIGLFFVLSKENERIIIKKIKPTLDIKPKEFDKKLLAKLSAQEKTVMNAVLENEGSIFQSELAEKTQMNKVQITRILDRLEGQGLVERKRRGMTNVVLLKRS